MKNLNDKVKDKTYREQNQSWLLFIKFCSYVFNIASGAAAAYACFWLGEKLFGSPIVSVIVAIIFLVIFEIAKRKTSGEFWQVAWFKRQIAWGWLVASFVLLLVSVGSSSFGSKQGANNLSPDAELVNADNRANEYKNRIAQLEKDNEKLSQQTDRKGKILYRVLPSIKANNHQIAELNQNVIRLENKLEGKNEILTESYAQDVDMAGWILVLITIFFEILFECCMCYIWLYYHRVHLELKAMGAFEEVIKKRTQKKIKSEVIEYVAPSKTKQKKKKRKKGKVKTADLHDLSKPNSQFSENKKFNPIGFFARQNKSETESETTPLSEVKQKSETAVLLVKQATQPKSETKQKSETALNLSTETIIDKRYLKQRCKQSFIRSQKKTSTQLVKQNNKKLFVSFKTRLLQLGVKTRIINDQGVKTVIFEE